ncbi:bifunctional phosphopantothenoylcysteine decarboxylase/phosphopantothenate--cysteine ligase CoaBC [Auraticoccus monumenti]|uniref:Coenzyme A biosynthesis bifunctional protein CoaBC n=1 Tax=Auraticoccus monumenti TaxID=675864 RepID=A0A1G7BD81_9ACTN|nr:bifunctional phosphopantothenoylcysteine decarboxylase/phosphopantothenate--cysteine ligase CoaBC [Auraticoccus monumenti]SDE24917.1 Phosphopantothenate-cysteine ligase /Phosphopantothenoylcysteine decarboxylase [Auraticoccus monumenti]
MAEVVLGVAGGIAAYKACSLLRLLKESGHGVTVVPTPNALRFVGLDTWQALSGRPVSTDVWTGSDVVPHVRLGRAADVVVVAPATADLLARAAGGRADDLLTNVLLTTTSPVLMAPAMHTEMWQHPATRDNVAVLRRRGVVVMDPASGRLTGADTGPGRLPEPEELHEQVDALLGAPAAAASAAAGDLAGRTVVVSAGGTRESLDPVRFLGNASSGRMGVALARAAALRGAEVHLVGAHLDVPPPSSVTVHRVGSTAELAERMTSLAAEADVLVMAAAVADYRPESSSEHKIKKSGDDGLELRLHQTVDVLAGLSASRRPGQVVVGFAAETVPDRAARLQVGRDKLARKGCDLLVVNDVTAGAVFGSPVTEVAVLSRDGGVVEHSGSKAAVAHHVWDAVLTQLG